MRILQNVEFLQVGTGRALGRALGGHWAGTAYCSSRNFYSNAHFTKCVVFTGGHWAGTEAGTGRAMGGLPRSIEITENTCRRQNV